MPAEQRTPRITVFVDSAPPEEAAAVRAVSLGATAATCTCVTQRLAALRQQQEKPAVAALRRRRRDADRRRRQAGRCGLTATDLQFAELYRHARQAGLLR